MERLTQKGTAYNVPGAEAPGQKYANGNLVRLRMNKTAGKGSILKELKCRDEEK